jgi:hypothetical protein
MRSARKSAVPDVERGGTIKAQSSLISFPGRSGGTMALKRCDSPRELRRPGGTLSALKRLVPKPLLGSGTSRQLSRKGIAGRFDRPSIAVFFFGSPI